MGFAVGAEEAGYLVPEKRKQQPDRGDIDGGDNEGVPQRLAHPVETARAEILAKDRANRAVKREERAEGYGNQPPDHGPSRHGCIAEIRHSSGDEGAGRRCRQLRQDSGPADCREGDKRSEKPLPVGNADQPMDDHYAVEAERQKREARQHIGYGRARDAEIEPEDEEEVENSGGNGARKHHEHGSPRVAGSAQYA